MFLQDNLVNTPGSRHRKKRVGRGNGSNRGTYCGLGNKGQKSRGSGKLHSTFTGGGGRSRFILGIPKSKGFSRLGQKPATVTINMLNLVYQDGEIVSAETLFQKGVLNSGQAKFKIVGNSKLNKKLTFDSSVRFSKSAQPST